MVKHWHFKAHSGPEHEDRLTILMIVAAVAVVVLCLFLTLHLPGGSQSWGYWFKVLQGPYSPW